MINFQVCSERQGKQEVPYSDDISLPFPLLLKFFFDLFLHLRGRAPYPESVPRSCILDRNTPDDILVLDAPEQPVELAGRGNQVSFSLSLLDRRSVPFDGNKFLVRRLRISFTVLLNINFGSLASGTNLPSTYFFLILILAQFPKLNFK